MLVLALIVCAFVSPAFAAEPKEWSFFVFLNADNNLDSFGVEDEKEMAAVGSNDKLNIVTLIDREKGPAEIHYIEKGNIKKIKDMGELDMGDYKLLVSWVKDMAEAYPAKHYAVVIWNHGSGWKNASNNVIKGISYDDSTGNHITTEQLGIAMKEIKEGLGKNLDILFMDACLMQMMEVAYAVKDSVGFVVASEETEPGDGYPYDEILGALKPGMEPVEFAKAAVKAYVASYNGGSQGNSASTQSAIDCSKLDALKDCIDGFAKASIAGKFAPQFKDALVKVQKFYYRTNIDLSHLVSLLKGSINEEGFQTAAKKLEAACDNAIVYGGNSGATMKNAKGLAIYFPSTSSSFSSEYNKLAFAKDSLWDEMVFDYYKKSTAPAIVADVMKGDFSSLRDYVSSANENNREVTKDLVSKLNFSVFSEGGCSQAIQDTVKSLIKELKDK